MFDQYYNLGTGTPTYMALVVIAFVFAPTFFAVEDVNPVRIFNLFSTLECVASKLAATKTKHWPANIVAHPSPLPHSDTADACLWLTSHVSSCRKRNSNRRLGACRLWKSQGESSRGSRRGSRPRRQRRWLRGRKIRRERGSRRNRAAPRGYGGSRGFEGGVVVPSSQAIQSVEGESLSRGGVCGTSYR